MGVLVAGVDRNRFSVDSWVWRRDVSVMTFKMMLVRMEMSNTKKDR